MKRLKDLLQDEMVLTVIMVIATLSVIFAAVAIPLSPLF